MNQIKRIAALCLSALLTLSPVALAQGPIDTRHPSSLTIDWTGETKSDVEFSLYRVADVSEQAQFTLSRDFAEYAVEINDLDSDGWRAAAQTLADYAEADGLATAAKGKTDDNGALVFDNLTPGLYLGVAQRFTADTRTYTVEPFLVSLPERGTDNSWEYEVTVTPKFTQTEIPQEETVSRKVLKVWKDDDNSAKNRPTSVTIQLLKDGQVQETVTLNEENNWKHTWTKLDADATWSVVEKQVPTGYTVSTTQEGTTFVVTNTYKTHKIPKTTTDTPTTTNHKLPRTGQLWWPVPVLAIGGILLFSIGWLRRQRG